MVISSWYRLSALQDSTSTLFGVSFIFLLLLLKLLSTHGNRNAPRRCQWFSPDFFYFGLAMIVKPLTYFSCRWSQERSRANTTLNGSIAQRSARSLCTHLKKKGCQLTATEMELMQERATRLSEQDRVALYKKIVLKNEMVTPRIPGKKNKTHQLCYQIVSRKKLITYTRWFSRRDLFIPKRWRSRSFAFPKGHVNSPSQKGHVRRTAR